MGSHLEKTQFPNHRNGSMGSQNNKMSPSRHRSSISPSHNITSKMVNQYHQKKSPMRIQTEENQIFTMVHSLEGSQRKATANSTMRSYKHAFFN